MKIAYVCADPGVPVFGQKGCSIHVQEVIRALQRQDVEVELFATRLGGDPPADLANVRVHPLPTIPKGDRAVREQVALATNPDTWLQLELSGPFDWVYERYSLWSFSAMEYAKSVGIPGLLEVNAPLIEEHANHRGLADRTSAEAVAKRVFNAATALIAVSTEVKTYLTHYVKDESSIHVIPNGVNPDRFLCHRQPRIVSQSKPFIVGFVGTLKPWHGLPILLDAFDQLHQRYPNTRLLMVGDGPEREPLTAEVASRGLQSAVHFTGAIAPDEVPGYLAAMDVAVAPYPDQTNFYFSPLKIYEYMAAGLPIVTSRIGQLTDVIQDRVTGLLCPPGDARALAAALEQLWRSPDLAFRLGQAARQAVIKHHTWDAIAQRLLNVAGFAVSPSLVGGGAVK